MMSRYRWVRQMSEHVDAESYDLGRISANIELIERDVRPDACLTIRNDMLKDVIDKIKAKGLLYLVQEISYTHSDVHIFRYKHLRKVIEEIEGLSPTVRAWAYGRLFGYSEAEISKFIQNMERV
jgi:hypothetical protein